HQSLYPRPEEYRRNYDGDSTAMGLFAPVMWAGGEARAKVVALSNSRSLAKIFQANFGRVTDGRMPAVQLRRREAPLRTSLLEDGVKAAPFLKWVGGKTSLLPELRRHVPTRYRRYHEPFVGGGALFFAVAPRRAILSDNNAELVHCYLQVRDNVHAVLAALADHVY